MNNLTIINDGKIGLTPRDLIDGCIGKFKSNIKQFLERDFNEIINNCLNENKEIDGLKIRKIYGYSYLQGMARAIDIISQGGFFASGYLNNEINKRYEEWKKGNREE